MGPLNDLQEWHALTFAIAGNLRMFPVRLPCREKTNGVKAALNQEPRWENRVRKNRKRHCGAEIGV